MTRKKRQDNIKHLSVLISLDTYNTLQEFSKIVGIPVSRVIDMLLTEQAVCLREYMQKTDLSEVLTTENPRPSQILGLLGKLMDTFYSQEDKKGE